jgi:putative tricarboxylic transport membrane protein
MVICKPKEFLSGMAFFLIACGIWTLTSRLDQGTARNLGPGFFPTALSYLLMGLSGLLILRSFFGEKERLPTPSRDAARSILAILGGSTVFGLLVAPAGLGPAVASSVLVGTLGMRGYGLKSAAIVAICLALGCSLVFVTLLGLHMPIIGPMLRL